MATERLKAPIKSMSLIISTQFCERFCYYGMKAILPLYLNTHLMYTEHESKEIFHTYMMLVYFFPLFGSFMADNWFGKFDIVLWLSLFYAGGNFMLATASGLNDDAIPKPLSQAALFLISFATGGMKPCSVAFGGDQYVVPEQESLLKRYFSIYYFMSSSASLMSTFLSPVLAERFTCYGRHSCYPLAFGVTGILMILSFVIFLCGKSGYINKKPVKGENTIILVIKCIGSAIKNRIFNSNRHPKPDHFIDYASHKNYSTVFRGQVKIMLKVLVIFVAYPVFWTLFDQKATSWIFLAKKMDRQIFGNIEILPDQMLLINAILLVIMIPVFEMFVYPLAAKINFLTKPLERMIWGAITLWLGFLCSSIIYIYIEQGTSMHVLWLMPQFFFVTLAEVLFSVTGVEFAYTDAPESMKSVIQAIWLLTSTFGNLLLVSISKLHIVQTGSPESIFYTALMGVDILLLMYLSHRYVKSKEEIAAQNASVALEEANQLINK